MTVLCVENRSGLSSQVNAGRFANLGVNPGDPPSLPIEVQAASMNERWENICQVGGQYERTLGEHNSPVL